MTSLQPQPAFIGFLAIIMFGVLACKGGEEETSQVVARVHDHTLLQSELERKLPKDLSTADSARAATAYVNGWIRDKAVLSLAEKELGEKQKDFSEQLENYRNSLIVYAYERAFINQKLDTIVSEKDIQTYYEQNLANFKLRNYILKVRFLKLSSDAPKIDKAEKWLESDDESDFDKLYDYCRKYAENFYFTNDNWLYLEEFLNEVPMPVTDWNNYLRNNAYIRFESGSFQYLVRIYDYKLKDDTSPLSFERNRIAELLLNRKKVELINKMRDDAVNNSYATKKIQVYTE